MQEHEIIAWFFFGPMYVFAAGSFILLVCVFASAWLAPVYVLFVLIYEGVVYMLKKKAPPSKDKLLFLEVKKVLTHLSSSKEQSVEFREGIKKVLVIVNLLEKSIK